MSLFSARKFEYTSPEPRSASPQSFDVELTRTDRYRVSRLRSFPSSLEGCEILCGSIDHKTGMSAAVTCDSIVVWKHMAQESIPITLSFPYQKNTYNIPPVVLFVPPLSELAKPGIVIIDAVSGIVTYYESLHTATVSGFVPANMSSFSLQVGLSSEFIASAEYIDGLSGVLCSTSTKKVFLLKLKDPHGHPCLAKSELCSSKRSFLSGMFSSTSASYDYNLYLEKAKICAMKQGLPRQILIQDSDGTLTVFEYQNGIIGGSVKIDLKTPLCSFLAEIYPHIYYTFQIRDIQLVSDNVYLVLADFDKEVSQQQRSLVIFKLIIDSTGVLILSSHKVMSVYTGVRDQPQLYAKEEKGRVSLFVVSSSSVLLMEIFEDSTNNWEDTVSTKTLVVASAVDPETASCLLMTNTGVLEVSATLTAASPLSLVDRLKSHIEQAVLFGKDDSNPVDFNIDQRDLYSSADVSKAVGSISHEIFYNKSAFLPQNVTLLESHLLKKSKVLLDLANYVGQNFVGLIDNDTELQAVVMLEKLAISERLYCEINEHQLCEFAESAIEKVETGCSLRDFFLCKVDRVGDLIKQLCVDLGNLEPAKQLLVKNVISSSLKQYYHVETNTKLGVLNLNYSASSVVPFFVESPDLVTCLNFDETSLFLNKLVYYATVDSLAWISAQPTTTQLQNVRDTLEQYLYANRSMWIQAMAQDETKTEYLDMFEHFQDFGSLVEYEISVNDQEMVSVLGHFLEKYQYDFARVLFERLITSNKLELLVKGFPSYKNHLDLFFEKESQFARYAWLNDMINNSDLLSAAAHLLKASETQNESVNDRMSQLSLAKLSLKVYESRQAVPQKSLLQVVEKQRVLVDLQKKLETVLSTFVTGPTVSKEVCISMISSTLLDRYDIIEKEKLLTRLEKYIETFTQKKSLSLLETVDLVTLLDPQLTSSMETNYSDVFALLSQIDGNPYVSLWLQRFTWRKLLLVDDWKKIESLSETKSESFIMDIIRGTAFYKTVKQLSPHVSLPQLKQIMTHTSYQDLKVVFADLGELSQVNEREMEDGVDCGLLEKLVNEAKLDKWVENIVLHM